jgi:thymidylate synthase
VAPEEPEGVVGNDPAPGVLTKLARDPGPRPHIEVADRPLDELEYEDVRLRDYDPATGLEFAVAE